MALACVAAPVMMMSLGLFVVSIFETHDKQQQIKYVLYKKQKQQYGSIIIRAGTRRYRYSRGSFCYCKLGRKQRKSILAVPYRTPFGDFRKEER
jgi:hypothetical protein